MSFFAHLGEAAAHGVELESHAMNAATHATDHSLGAVERALPNAERTLPTATRVVDTGTHAGANTVSHAAPRAVEEAETAAVKSIPSATERELKITRGIETRRTVGRTLPYVAGLTGVILLPHQLHNVFGVFNHEASQIATTVGDGILKAERELAHKYSELGGAVSGALGGPILKTGMGLLVVGLGAFVAYEVYRRT